MSSRPDLLRILIPFIAAVFGFFAGLVAGGFAEMLIVPLALLATGHSHPLVVLDESFRSNPPGSLALVMIAGYLTTAFLGAIAAYKTARRFSPRWRPPLPWTTAQFINRARNFLHKRSRIEKTIRSGGDHEGSKQNDPGQS
jgi:hypothetical protein